MNCFNREFGNAHCALYQANRPCVFPDKIIMSSFLFSLCCISSVSFFPSILTYFWNPALQAAPMALWTSGIPSTRSGCANSIATPPASPRWPSATTAPPWPSPPPTCTRWTTLSTPRTASTSAKWQMQKQSPSECLLQLHLSLSVPPPRDLLIFLNSWIVLLMAGDSAAWQ